MKLAGDGAGFDEAASRGSLDSPVSELLQC